MSTALQAAARCGRGEPPPFATQRLLRAPLAALGVTATDPARQQVHQCVRAVTVRGTFPTPPARRLCLSPPLPSLPPPTVLCTHPAPLLGASTCPCGKHGGAVWLGQTGFYGRTGSYRRTGSYGRTGYCGRTGFYRRRGTPSPSAARGGARGGAARNGREGVSEEARPGGGGGVAFGTLARGRYGFASDCPRLSVRVRAGARRCPCPARPVGH